MERVYVEEPVYEEFVVKLTRKVAELRQGPDDRSCSYAPRTAGSAMISREPTVSSGPQLRELEAPQ